MNQNLLDDIENYINFLEDAGYIIALSFVSKSAKNCFLPLIHYDFHPLKVCNYLKQNEGTKGKCVINKMKFLEKDIQKPFYVMPTRGCAMLPPVSVTLQCRVSA